MKVLIISFLTILLIACGDGNNTNGATTNYYSASPNQSYQINTESQNGVESLTLNIVTSTGNILNNAPLTMVGNNSYSFSGNMTGGNITGTLVLKNNQLGI